ncbi:hypothetical protein ACFE04_018356 [Oxalis oulophora]
MGICISRASPEIHHNNRVSPNAFDFQQNFAPNQIDNLTGSLHSLKGSKGVNQDAAILYQGYGAEDAALCGVFDGHGQNGHIVSSIVRNRLPQLLAQQIALTKNNIENEKNVEEFNIGIWEEACVTAYKVMDKEIKLKESLDCSCSGTTAVVVIRQGDDLVIANLGDSRAVLGTMTDSGLKAVPLTIDLKPSLSSEAERIRKCNGRVLALKEEPHIHRVWLPNEDAPGLAMSRAFGDYMLKSYGIIAIPDISYHCLTSEDQFIVLASDGVWDVLNNSEVASIIMSTDNEDSAAKNVADVAAASWKTKFPTSKMDDCTVVCLFLQKG